MQYIYLIRCLTMQADYSQLILQRLSTTPKLFSTDLQQEFNLSAEQIYAHLVSLSSLEYIRLNAKKTTTLFLTKEGLFYAQNGTPQAKIYQMASLAGTPQKDIESQLKDNYKIGFGNAMRKKIIALKDGKVYRAKEQFIDEDRNRMLAVLNKKEISTEDLKQLKSRKLVQERQRTIYEIERGLQYREKKVELATQLTSAMIANGTWQGLQFKKFLCTAKGEEIENGNLHVLMKTKQQFMEILLQMGFEEMSTDRYVESCFWNFDSLFQPQAHPARDAHDTFFVSDPAAGTLPNADYVEEVKKVHEVGGYGSFGYDYKWDVKEAQKNVLRTHTTAVSSRVLKQIAQEPFRPRKFFSIDRVFRNQTLDSTHLAQFHQVEGFVIDKNLGLNHLIGVLTEFYKKIGIKKIWLKPTYNPYTEPSMEIYGLHPILNRKVEIGNSGIFRPEMLRTMGFAEDVSVIAWGLSLERPTMIQFGIPNIKELFGPGVSLKKIKDSAIYCL